MNQNFDELSLNVISCLINCMKREIHEWQFLPFIGILREKLADFRAISREIDEITWIRLEIDFAIYDWSET